MVNFIYITLDTTAPSNPSITIGGGLTSTTNQLVNLEIKTGDVSTDNYQMKIWGNVDNEYSANIKSTEELSVWIPFTTNPQIKLSSGDGTKTVNVRIRDDVHNASTIATSSIKLDTKIPTVTTTAVDVPRVSKIAGKDTFSFAFSADKDIAEYKVKLVGVIEATHATGTTITTSNGSMNVSGVTSITEGTSTTVTIKSADLGSVADGQKIIKVFVKDTLGNWSA